YQVSDISAVHTTADADNTIVLFFLTLSLYFIYELPEPCRPFVHGYQTRAADLIITMAIRANTIGVKNNVRVRCIHDTTGTNSIFYHLILMALPRLKNAKILIFGLF